MSWWVVRNASGIAVVAEPDQAGAAAAGTVIGGPYASQAAAQSAAGTGGSSGGGTGGCGAQAIYQALISAGFSTVQATGAMANAIAESTLNPEARIRDTNGYYSNGLWQFNEKSYPNSASLVTGNCAQDITQQVGFLKSVVSGQALAGSTGAEVAGNFAANFERCSTCSQGNTGTNGWSTRVANAATVQAWIASGSWPTSAAGITGNAASGASGATLTASSTRCLVGGNSVIPCLLDASQARGIIGGLCLGGGALLVFGGIVLMAVMSGGPAAVAGRAVAGAVPAAGGVAKVAGAVAVGPTDRAYFAERRTMARERRAQRTAAQQQAGVDAARAS